MTPTLGLSPGPVADPLGIPATGWTLNNKLVSVILQCRLPRSRGGFLRSTEGVAQFPAVAVGCRVVEALDRRRPRRFAERLSTVEFLSFGTDAELKTEQDYGNR